ncbi:MAG: thioredoxin fold domain-containing protein [Bacteroidetes bacterium]|nr:thioredoxin fold domain-containing protein [Bacteroidota bacterium]
MKKTISLLSFIAVLALHSCSGNTQPGSETNYNLEATAFAEKINELPTAPLIDVRTPGEFADGHLRQAKNIDWNSSSFESDIQALDKTQPVFVYCLSGGRSSSAAAKMRAIGFSKVYELDGGIMKWRAANLPEDDTNNGGMTMEEYQALLNTDKKVLIDFYAEWCGPCKKMAPYLNQMKYDLQDSVEIVRIDADKNQALAKSLNIDALPSLLLYKNKSVVWQQNGFISQEDLTKVISQN